MYKIINFLTDQQVQVTETYQQAAEFLREKGYFNPFAQFFLLLDPHTNAHKPPVFKVIRPQPKPEEAIQ